MASVLVTFRKISYKEIIIPEDTVFTIGRDNDNMLVLDNDDVSRFHAQVTRLGPSFYIVDLGSTNGTTLNGKRIWSRASLKDFDRIGIGNFDITFLYAASDKESFEDTCDGTATMPVAKPAIKANKAIRKK